MKYNKLPINELDPSPTEVSPLANFDNRVDVLKLTGYIKGEPDLALDPFADLYKIPTYKSAIDFTGGIRSMISYSVKLDDEKNKRVINLLDLIIDENQRLYTGSMAYSSSEQTENQFLNEIRGRWNGHVDEIKSILAEYLGYDEKRSFNQEADSFIAGLYGILPSYLSIQPYNKREKANRVNEYRQKMRQNLSKSASDQMATYLRGVMESLNNSPK